jgi:F420-dependent oxidoreductase-like protein
MRIGCTANLDARSVDDSIADARLAEAAGLDSYVVPGGWRDALMLAALDGRAVPRIGFTTGIVGLYNMQPVALAEAALTANDALGGRLTLGLGLSHFHMVEQRFGLKFERPIRYLREYLTILMGCLEHQKIDFTGEMVSAHTELRLAGMPKPRVLIAALGPQAVRVTGRLADGTLTFMVPLKSLEAMTLPEASAAAAEAGRPRPYFGVQVPVALTTDEDRVRGQIAKQFERYSNGYYPSYKAALDRDGQQLDPGTVAIVGDEATVRRELQRYRDIGIDEVCGVLGGHPDELARTRAFLGALAHARAFA